LSNSDKKQKRGIEAKGAASNKKRDCAKIGNQRLTVISLCCREKVQGEGREERSEGKRKSMTLKSRWAGHAAFSRGSVNKP
jgi:hypothetical protein